MIRLVITGIAGKMGSAILKLALADSEIIVTGAIEAKNHPMINKTVYGGEGKASIAVVDDLSRIIDTCDVVIDFTDPGATLEHFRIAAANKKAIIVGSTGISDGDLVKIKGMEGARAVISPNMSVGMNLMFDAVEKLARILKEGYDIEIVEMHHRLKKDAPSGTAIKLMEVIEAAQPERGWMEIFGRKGMTGERHKDEIGILALRGGDVVGEHTVMFAGIGERLEITHRAYSRENFAQGAILAAKWIANKGIGIYTMKDVLGLNLFHPE
ncbi:MAG: 4-hydroxy-tetrahydrodipicolinate reductase [Syntrophus sp. (in: bacteria)]|nr:4-hydroxy-tetrahydrodipicolinate reductase [Syntrophus sp. (in: bacteria)]